MSKRAPVSAREFFGRNIQTPGSQDALIAECVRASKITRSTLVNHVRYGVPIGRVSAKKLSDWNAEIDFAKTLANES